MHLQKTLCTTTMNQSSIVGSMKLKIKKLGDLWAPVMHFLIQRKVDYKF